MTKKLRKAERMEAPPKEYLIKHLIEGVSYHRAGHEIDKEIVKVRYEAALARDAFDEELYERLANLAMGIYYLGKKEYNDAEYYLELALTDFSPHSLLLSEGLEKLLSDEQKKIVLPPALLLMGETLFAIGEKEAREGKPHEAWKCTKKALKHYEEAIAFDYAPAKTRYAEQLLSKSQSLRSEFKKYKNALQEADSLAKARKYDKAVLIYKSAEIIICRVFGETKHLYKRAKALYPSAIKVDTLEQLEEQFSMFKHAYEKERKRINKISKITGLDGFQILSRFLEAKKKDTAEIIDELERGESKVSELKSLAERYEAKWGDELVPPESIARELELSGTLETEKKEGAEFDEETEDSALDLQLAVLRDISIELHGKLLEEIIGANKENLSVNTLRTIQNDIRREYPDFGYMIIEKDYSITNNLKNRESSLEALKAYSEQLYNYLVNCVGEEEAMNAIIKPTKTFIDKENIKNMPISVKDPLANFLPENIVAELADEILLGEPVLGEGDEAQSQLDIDYAPPLEFANPYDGIEQVVRETEDVETVQVQMPLLASYFTGEFYAKKWGKQFAELYNKELRENYPPSTHTQREVIDKTIDKTSKTCSESFVTALTCPESVKLFYTSIAFNMFRKYAEGYISQRRGRYLTENDVKEIINSTPAVLETQEVTQYGK